MQRAAAHAVAQARAGRRGAARRERVPGAQRRQTRRGDRLFHQGDGHEGDTAADRADDTAAAGETTQNGGDAASPAIAPPMISETG